MKSYITSLAIISTALSAPAAAQDAESILTEAAATYQGLQSFSADFGQTLEDMSGTLESRGELMQSGKDRFAMKFSDPAGDAIILDGNHLWVYTPSSVPGQVLRFPAPTTTMSSPNVIAWFLDRPTERYESTWLRSESIDGGTADVLKLVPVDRTLPFRSATIWISRSDHLPRKVEVQESARASRTVTLSNIRTNVSMEPDTFEFTVPDGVRVIDQ